MCYSFELFDPSAVPEPSTGTLRPALETYSEGLVKAAPGEGDGPLNQPLEGSQTVTLGVPLAISPYIPDRVFTAVFKVDPKGTTYPKDPSATSLFRRGRTGGGGG